MNLDTKDVQVGSIVRKEENSDTAYKVEKIENDIVTLKDKDGNETTSSSSSLYAASEDQVKSFAENTAPQTGQDYSQNVTDSTASNLSDTTLEINPTRIDDACSFWNQIIASENIESTNVESAFEALTSQGVATAYIPSLKNALSQVTTLATKISSTIENAKNEQVSVDEAAKNKNESTYTSYSYTTTRSSSGSSGSSGSKGSSSSSSSGSRGSSSSRSSGGYSGGGATSSSNASPSVNNNDKNIEINTDAVKALNNMNYANYDVFLKGLTSIISGNATLEVYLQDERYADVLKEKLSSIQGLSSDIKQVISSMDPKTLQLTLQNWYTDTSVVTDTAKSVVYNYTEALAKNSNTSINDFIKKSGKDVVSSFEDAHTTIDKMIKTGTVQEDLLNIYDGNNISDKKETTVALVRNIIDEVAKKNNTSSEIMLTDANKSETLKTEMTKISRSLAYVKSLNSLSSANIANALESILK